MAMFIGSTYQSMTSSAQPGNHYYDYHPFFCTWRISRMPRLHLPSTPGGLRWWDWRIVDHFKFTKWASRLVRKKIFGPDILLTLWVTHKVILALQHSPGMFWSGRLYLVLYVCRFTLVVTNMRVQDFQQFNSHVGHRLHDPLFVNGRPCQNIGKKRSEPPLVRSGSHPVGTNTIQKNHIQQQFMFLYF